MTDSATRFDYSRSYIAGLLDMTGRVRFQLSATDDGQYSVRPSLRIYPYKTPMREAVIGSFLDDRGYEYQLVDRRNSANYFNISYKSELEDIQEYLTGYSSHLQRELKFVTTTFTKNFGNQLLPPKKAYQFLLTRNELRFGWYPRAPNLYRPDDITSEHDFDTSHITIPELPEGDFRSNYSLDYIAGLFDGRCRYRPSIAESEEHNVGYMLYPTAQVYRNGVTSQVIEHFREFCNDYNLKVGDSSDQHTFGFVFTGPGAIRRILEVVLSELTVNLEPSLYLEEVVLPRFEAADHLSKQGFFDTLIVLEQVAIGSDGTYSPNQYTSDFFAELWGDELDFGDPEPNPDEPTAPSDKEDELPSLLEGYDSVTVSAEAYRDIPGRYQTLVNRHHRDRNMVKMLKEVYADRCQLCGDRRARPDGTGYSEIHHIRPLGDPHEGSDVKSNMIVVCPNHHADVDNGVLTINPETLEIHHPYDRSVDGRKLTVKSDHEVSIPCLEYHDEHIATNSEINS